MKNQLCTLFFLAICFAFNLSCKERTKKNTNKNLFLENIENTGSMDSLVDDSALPIDTYNDTDPERGLWQNPELVIRKFDSLEGKTIADIGSGTGYFTFPLSRMAKKVIAIEIEQRYLDYIEDRKLELPIEQADVIETRLTVEDEPNLHTGEVDAVLMVNVFYYLKNRVEYMRIVNEAIKNNGMLVLVDFKPGDLPVGPVDNKAASSTVVDILKKAGFENIQVDENSLEYQYIITAK